jgi:hypothetical protein
MSQPLDQVLARALGDFVPERPDRPPWHQPTLDQVQVAATGVVAVVPLAIADRVRLSGLDRRVPDPYAELPEDHTPAGWGVSAA